MNVKSSYIMPPYKYAQDVFERKKFSVCIIITMTSTRDKVFRHGYFKVYRTLFVVLHSYVDHKMLYKVYIP